jgi:hypothetical protein
MNVVRLGPGLEIAKPLPAEEILNNRQFFIIPPPEAIIPRSSEDAEPGLAEDIPVIDRTTAAHWRQIAFHNLQINGPGMEPDYVALHTEQLIVHLGAVGVAEIPEAA